MPEKPGAAGNRRRRYMTTPAQDALIQAAARERHVPEHAVFHEIVDAGFDAYFGVAEDGDIDAVRADLREIREATARAEAAAREAGMANLAATAWTQRASLGLLRWLLISAGQDADDARIPWCAASRHLSTADCGIAVRVFESAGARIAAGGGFAASLEGACRDTGVPWEDFAGARPGRRGHGADDASASGHGQPNNGNKRRRADGGKRKGNRR